MNEGGGKNPLPRAYRVSAQDEGWEILKGPTKVDVVKEKPKRAKGEVR